MRLLMLVACVFLGLIMAADAQSEPTKICGLDGFNVQYLTLAKYWEFNTTLSENFCNSKDVLTCTTFFSMCQNLENDKCGSVASGRVCQEITFLNESKRYAVLGSADTELHGVNLRDANGFTTTWNTTTTTEKCPNGTNVAFKFICDKRSMWSVYDKYVTKDVLFATVQKDCNYMVTLRYDGACYIPPAQPILNCSDGKEDFIDLEFFPRWTLSLTNSSVCQPLPSLKVASCTIQVGFCRAVPWHSANYNCYDSSMCQEVTYSDGNTESYSMGAYSVDTKLIYNGKGELDGFHYEMPIGNPTPNCIEGLNTSVTVLCDRNANWTIGIIESKDVRVIYDGACKYRVDMLWNGACLAPPTSPPSHHVNGGWVFFGLLCAAVFVLVTYCVVGAAIQSFFNGKHGIEVMPNYTFWKAVFNIITCSAFDKNKSSKYSNI